MKIHVLKFAKRVDSDEVAHNEPPHLDLLFWLLRVFIKRRQEAKMTASNHFLAASNSILGIKMYTNAKKLTASN